MSEKGALFRNYPWIILYMTDVGAPKKLKHQASESTGTKTFPDI